MQQKVINVTKNSLYLFKNFSQYFNALCFNSKQPNHQLTNLA